MRENAKKPTLNVTGMVELALLTAIVLVLQLTGFAIRLPFLTTPVSLVLVPIALGAMLLGPYAGAFLGFVFGMEVFLVCGVMATDPFTALLFSQHPALTFFVCVLKSTVAGFAAGLLYRAIEKKSRLAGSFAAAAVTPILNTGIFILGCVAMMNTINDVASGMNQSFFYFVVITCAGINFLFELLVNLVLAPVLCRLVQIITKRRPEIG